MTRIEGMEVFGEDGGMRALYEDYVSDLRASRNVAVESAEAGLWDSAIEFHQRCLNILGYMQRKFPQYLTHRVEDSVLDTSCKLIELCVGRRAA